MRTSFVSGHGIFATLWLFASASLACQGDDIEPPSDIDVRVSDAIVTVATVTWATNVERNGYVEFGTTEALGNTTPQGSDPTTQHETQLRGLAADTEYFFRVVVADGEDTVASEIESFRTGSLPIGLPKLTVTGTNHTAGYTLLPLLGRTSAVTIVDPAGNYVWYHVNNDGLDVYRARLSLDGEAVLYNTARVSGEPAENAQLVRIAFDGSEVTKIPVPLLAHDFVELPDGSIAAIVVEYRDFEGQPLRGDKIVEVAPDGTQTTIWSAWDCFDPSIHHGDVLGWTFANALDFDPSDNAYYVGMRSFSSIAKIDRATGQCQWVFGDQAGTISFAGGSPRFLHQHQFEVRGSSVLVFDNEGAFEDQSRVLEYTIDFAANEATHVWTYTSLPTVQTLVLGEPMRLPNDNLLVSWGMAGQLEEVDSQGVSMWKVNAPVGYAFGFHSAYTSLYTP